MILCPHCKNEHPDNAEYCPLTGKVIPLPHAPIISTASIVCKNCKNIIPVGSQFCPDCGEVVPIIESLEQRDLKSYRLGNRLKFYLVGFCCVILISALTIFFIKNRWSEFRPAQQKNPVSTQYYLTNQPTGSIVKTSVDSASTYSLSLAILSTPSLSPTKKNTFIPTNSLVIPSCPGTLPTRLHIGQQAEVTTSGKAWQLSLRSEPNLNAAQIHVIAAGRNLVILDGPICADGSYWWDIRSEQGFEGWSREGDSEDYWIDPLP